MILCSRYFCAAKKQLGLLRHLTSKVKSAKKEEPIDYLAKLQAWCNVEEKNGFIVPPFKKSFQYAHSIAARDQMGQYTYLQLYLSAKKLGYQISNICGGGACKPVASVCEPNVLYTMVQWATWMSGQVAMPLNDCYSIEMISEIIKRSSCRFIICTEKYEQVAKIIADEFDIAYCIVDHAFMVPQNLVPTDLKKQLLLFGDRVIIEGALNNDFYTTKNALLQTQLLPNGKYYACMLTHQNIAQQIELQQLAWNFTAKDVVMPFLPYNHIHDWANAVFCAGGSLVLPESSNATENWHIMTDVKNAVNFVTGTPAIYEKLVHQHEKKFAQDESMVESIRHYCQTQIRAMVCGYAPLSYATYTRWKEITGHDIKEHYSLPETGLVLANTSQIVEEGTLAPGVVGRPLPGVEVRLVNKNNQVLDNESSNEMNSTVFGELQVYGKGVIESTALEKDSQSEKFAEKYFRTEDYMLFENDVFKLIGKSESNIVRVGNRFVLCAELEHVLLSHPQIKQALVGATSDPTWGQRVSAVCVLKPNSELDIMNLKMFCNKFVPNYKIPTRLKIVEELPKDVTKICREEFMSKYFDEKPN